MLAEMQTKKEAFKLLFQLLLKSPWRLLEKLTRDLHMTQLLHPGLHLNDAKTTYHRKLAQ